MGERLHHPALWVGPHELPCVCLIPSDEEQVASGGGGWGGDEQPEQERGHEPQTGPTGGIGSLFVRPQTREPEQKQEQGHDQQDKPHLFVRVVRYTAADDQKISETTPCQRDKRRQETWRDGLPIPRPPQAQPQPDAGQIELRPEGEGDEQRPKGGGGRGCNC